MAHSAANNGRMTFERVVLFCILALGAGLRFYNLGAPSMWWDEALVPLINRFPMESILEWLRTTEMHPPLYYLLFKALMPEYASDATLRLLSALPGTACIYLLYRIGKDLFGPAAGLAAAGLLAVNPYAVWLSRIVRPYGLFLFFFLVSLLALIRWARTGSRRALLTMIASNLCLYWTHYMMIILAPALGVAVLMRSWPRLRDFWIFCAATIASFLSILPFFLHNLKASWTKGGSLLHVLTSSGANAFKLVWFFNGPARWILLPLAVYGLWLAARRDKGSFWTAASIAVIPVAVIAARGLNWTEEPRYFLALQPVLLIAAGLAAVTLAKRCGPRAERWAPAALTAALLPALLWHHGSLYREEATFSIDWIKYKTAARMIPAIVRPGEPSVVSDQGLHNALDWHLERQGGANPLRMVNITPHDREAILNFLWFGSMGHIAQTQQELAGKFPGMVEVGTVGRLTFLKAVVQRAPAAVAALLPWERTFRGLAGFLGESHALEGLNPTPFWGVELQPSQNGRTGYVEFLVENGTPDAPRRVELAVRYVNEGEDNTLRLLARFDGEPWIEAASSRGPDRHFYRRAFLDRDRPFRRLLVRVEMNCAMKTAKYPGGNLDSLRLSEVTAAMRPLADVAD